MVNQFFVRRDVLGASRLLFLVLLASVAMLNHAQAQFSTYLELTASELHEGPSGDYLYGGTAGALLDGPTLFKRAIVSADLQVRDVLNGGERLVGVAIGPRFSFPLKTLKLTPHAEFLVGFARYRASNSLGAENTTDEQWQSNAGVSRDLSAHLDVVADFSYSQYGANFAQYHPKSYSAGVMYHFAKR